MAGAPAKLVVVDRDGVINEDSGEFIKSVAEWRPIAGSLEGIAALTQAGYRVVVVTNQSGIARGLLTEEILRDIHERMRSAVRAAGGELAAVYFCPHHPDDGCDCRKPRTALLRRAERELGVALAGVPFIGDRTSDVEAAEAVGARPILVRTGSGAVAARGMDPGRAEVFDDLGAAARALLAESRG
ncbi:MAG TPA: D-glycero-beta-D-manno-heptose 1,7-bisphosphate 7-phosphatase [Gammaproteobacteria bacterium]|nr:D-glycero-beta-D-manno-heptose 1,7-bisphosphate 7-phosphatase [Gammaproteobacteria bacterium]